MFCGTRRKKEIAGIIGFSGQLVGKEVLKNEITSYPPILLINGDQDELIPIQEQAIAVKVLRQENISVRNHIVKGLGHSIDLEGIQMAREFLTKILAIK
jgi:phospholipase/carboxylesterase